MIYDPSARDREHAVPCQRCRRDNSAWRNDGLCDPCGEMLVCDGCGENMAVASSSDDETGLGFCLRCTTLDWPDEDDDGS